MSVGTLFTEDFLAEGIKQSAAWRDLSDANVSAAREQIAAIFAGVASPGTLNEAQTQHRIIEPILTALGWTGVLAVQTNIERRQRPNVSDYTFFPDISAFAAADHAAHHDTKLKHAVHLVFPRPCGRQHDFHRARSRPAAAVEPVSRTMTEKAPRDLLLDRVNAGELTPAAAEEEAKRVGLEPLQPPDPNPELFDPTQEAQWTLPMAVAWIAHREISAVRNRWETYRSKFWIWQERRFPDGPGGQMRSGWVLGRHGKTTMAALTFATDPEATKERDPRFSMSPTTPG